MNTKLYTVYVSLVGAGCGYVVVNHFLFADSLTLRNALIQGFFVGFGLAVVTIEIVARVKTARINGWVTAFGCGLPSNGMFTRAAHTRLFPGRINVPQEAMYWRTNVDSMGHTLSGEHDYRMHFPPEGLPPNDAFWSLTMADAGDYLITGPRWKGQVPTGMTRISSPTNSVLSSAESSCTATATFRRPIILRSRYRSRRQGDGWRNS